MNESSENDLSLTTDASNHDMPTSKDTLTCCYLQPKLTDKQQLFTVDESKEHEYLYAKFKTNLTCAQFYEEKIRSLLEIFSEVIENSSFHFV
jgi:hypothetical protein